MARGEGHPLFHRVRAGGGAVTALALALLAGCGSSTSTTSGAAATLTPAPTPAASTPAGSTTTATPSPAASSSSTSSSDTLGGLAALVLLHSVTTSNGLDLRIATPGGHTPARSVVVLPINSYIWDAGHGKVLVNETGSNTLVVVDLSTGSSHTVATDQTGVSGALSPDGTKAAYLASPGSGGGTKLVVTTLASGATQTLGTYSGAAPDPVAWTDKILANLIVPFSDAPAQGLALIDPSNGNQVAKSTGVAQNGFAACQSGADVAAVDHSSGLGDDGEGAQPGGIPGPPQPANTLRLVTVGGAQTVLRKAAHHQISPLSCVGRDGFTIYTDGSAIGGFAGISQSADFGLFLAGPSGPPTQIDHYGPTYAGAVLYQDGSTVAAERLDSSGATLVELSTIGKAAVTLDTVPGAIGGRVDLISAA